VANNTINSFSGRVSHAVAFLKSRKAVVWKSTFGLIFDSRSQSTLEGQAMLSLLSTVIWANGEVKPEEEGILRSFLSDEGYSDAEIDEIAQSIRSKAGMGHEEAIQTLCDLPGDDGRQLREKLISALVAVALADDSYSESEKTSVREVGRQLGVSSTTVSTMEEACVAQRHKRIRILGSGSGILAALAVLLIFILAATLLKSVLFGLTLAYIAAPLQRW